MDENMKELLLKMRELGISEEEFRKTLNAASVKEEEQPADKEAFDKTMKEVRSTFKAIIKELYKSDANVDKSVFKEVMSPTLFKAEYRELAIAEITRIVRFLDEMVLKLQSMNSREEMQETFFNMMVLYEDTFYGNVSLFKDVPLNVLSAFASKIGADKAAAYKIVREQEEIGIAILKTEEDVEKAKEDMLNLMASVFRTRLDITFEDIFVKEFIRLVGLKEYAFEKIVTQNDIFVMYGTIIAALLLTGLVKSRSILKIALSDLKTEVADRENSEEVLKLIGEIE